MSGDPYNAAVREAFSDPAHAGDVDAGIVAYFEDQGLCIRLSAELGGAVLTSLRFRVWGCPHVIAAAEWFCRNFEGAAVAALEDFQTSQIMQELAVPAEKTGRILVFEDTVRSLRAAIQDHLASK